MDDKTRKRIAQLHALMGSSNPHERNSAWDKLDELLRKHKKTWNDIPELLQATAEAPAEENVSATNGTKGGDICCLELANFILHGYVTLKEHEYLAVALWVLHTHVYQRFMVSPRLALLSPVRGCGKTTALHVLEALVSKAHRTDSISPAAIYHLINLHRPTFLLDEADNLGLMTNETLRAVLNSGHRKGGHRTIMSRGHPRDYQLFGPAAFGAIGMLPLPLMHRSIILHMERQAMPAPRQLSDKDLEDTRRDLNAIYTQVYQWANSGKLVLDPDPALPKELRNRVADNWRPLISIANSFGSAWAEKAWEAALV